jgi:hypothetical protein
VRRDIAHLLWREGCAFFALSFEELLEWMAVQEFANKICMLALGRQVVDPRYILVLHHPCFAGHLLECLHLPWVRGEFVIEKLDAYRRTTAGICRLE